MSLRCCLRRGEHAEHEFVLILLLSGMGHIQEEMSISQNMPLGFHVSVLSIVPVKNHLKHHEP